MQVLKFGGSSVANPENINKVISIIQKASQDGDKVVVVLSAFGGITDGLLEAAALAAKADESYTQKLEFIVDRHLNAVKELIPLDKQSGVLSMVKKYCNNIEDICKGVFLLKELSAHTKDSIISYGEILSTRIFSAKLDSLKIKNTWKDSREVLITNSEYGRAAVNFTATENNIQEFISTLDTDFLIMPGFIGSDKNGNTTTFGRGGSDYTASILAAVLKASVVQIWTDVSGMMTADPGLVSNAKIIHNISYQEAMELSHFGAKVIYPRTIQPAMSTGIPIQIKNTFAPDDEGTRIQKVPYLNGNSIRGISSINKLALLSLEGSGMVGIPGFSKRLFEALSNEKINVNLITQSSSEYSICVAIEEEFSDRAKEVIDETFAYEIETGKIQSLLVEKSHSIIAVVGDNMKNHPGISGKMFGALGRNGVNVRAIAQGSSERNISAVISTKDVKKAVNVLHEEFFETSYKQINLFISGTGNVGSKLLAQIKEQQNYLKEEMKLQLRVAGIANSRKMYFAENEVDLSNWKEALQEGEPMNVSAFSDRITSLNLRNSVYVDVTANSEIAMTYPQYLKKSISVVACNKVACSSSYQYYKQLKNLSREFNAPVLFETNVGAGLPVIGTLNDLLRSGDKVTRIEAVLSGTLNFVFNNYTGEKSFAQVVRQAQAEGYTEPDPRLDLSGVDVARKIMILARESGAVLEMEDINNNSFMPESCMEGDVENFYSEMEKHEAHFADLVKAATAEGKKLKFVASFEEGKATVGLQHIDPAHDFYHLYGKDNAVLFYTLRYSEQPLVIKGAGAGAEVTASGVFADIIRAGS
ncbi:MAG: bifunctional aspartate kinase/homoserine dehydrogenase I [Ginsengibacter sp.]